MRLTIARALLLVGGLSASLCAWGEHRLPCPTVAPDVFLFQADEAPNGVPSPATGMETDADSLRVCGMLQRASSLPADSTIILAYARGFQGTPYLGGTLETFPFEHLVVRTDSVDCTTFVEYVLAMALTNAAQPKVDRTTYTRFKHHLQLIRYRGGNIAGYTSRLHYFTDWIYDNQKKGIVREVTQSSPHAIRTVDLNFMTTHASLYPYLKADTSLLHQMRRLEQPWTGYHMPYIPKERLNEGRETLQIQDGDILTLVTNTRGLDVVHVGFACWINNQLHLLHASSAKEKVLLDPLTLYQYCKNKKSQLGIRVIRPLLYLR